MNERIEHCLYQSGLTAQGCWDELDDYAKQGIEKFAELIVRECVEICDAKRAEYTKLSKDADNFTDKNLWAEGEISAHRIRISIQEHFGVEE